MKPVSVAELEELRRSDDDLVIVDVRTAEEYAEGHVDGAIHVPVDRVEHDAGKLRGAGRIVAVCTKGGHRSQGAARALSERGLDATFLEGGTLAWMAEHASDR